MSAVSRHVLSTALRASTSRSLTRTFAAASVAAPPQPDLSEEAKAAARANDVPLPVGRAQFPVPTDPYKLPTTSRSKPQFSDTRIKLVKGLARLMGYNSRTTTAIRETSRMMRGIVEAVDRSSTYWYDVCALPPTYQSFFQLHLMYVLVLTARLRALDPNMAPPLTPLPESSRPSDTQRGAKALIPRSGPELHLLTKPNPQAYTSELVNHFFELTEGQMRNVLGRGERERVVKKYMDEMAQQWRGAGVSLDYVLGLEASDEQGDRVRTDAEMASWIWRNLFSARGLESPMPRGDVPGEDDGVAVKEVEMAEQLETIVKFVRRELKRLERLQDIDVMGGDVGVWGTPTE